MDLLSSRIVPRTTFVSLLSHRGVSIEEIARLAGHATTRTTEIVYRRELRPVITTGAEIMDQLFTATYPPAPPQNRRGPAHASHRFPGYLTSRLHKAVATQPTPAGHHTTRPFTGRHQFR